jgi:outer membrane protein assembly factor BamB
MSDMTTTQTVVTTRSKPLRLWPGVAAVALMWLLRFVVPPFAGDFAGYALMGGLACVLLVLAWWLLFSRAPWVERVGAVVLMVAAVLAVRLIVHPSIAGGMMGLMPVILAIPLLSLALVVWAAVSRSFPPTLRRTSLVAAMVLACLPLLLIRTDGIRGAGSDLAWRWTPTAEQRLLAQTSDDVLMPPPAAPADAAPEPEPRAEPAPAPDIAAESPAPAPSTAPATAPVAAPRAAWPGFRGPARDGAVRGVRIESDWSRNPPVKLWSHPIGPGWSSFAVSGDLIYTQEQRGDDELVSCYRLSTGQPVWRHRDPVRFWESNGGAGPRATPTVHDGRVYTFGATGTVNALDAETGRVVWSRNASADTGVEIPEWGFASSPLAVDDIIVIAVSGQPVAYDAATGAERWRGPAGGAGYSSAHLATIGGVPQILMARGGKTISLAPADGTLLWEHSGPAAASIVQPAVIGDTDVLIAPADAMGGMGLRRLAAARGAGGWTVEQRWASRGLKPYFNDFVAHKGHAYGFDGSILSAIDLEDGERKWKGGRYGNGQLILLADQDLLLVISEDGELALVSATPDKFTEIARFPALDAKTWNHPVLVGDVLLVRNGEEMAAFRLARAGR